MTAKADAPLAPEAGATPDSAAPDSSGHDAASPSTAAMEAAFLRDVAFSPALEPQDTAPLQPGDTIGRFRIEQRLGRGGMGVVYAAHDLTLGRKVALKLLASSSADGREPEARLLREARATALVSHPNLATLFDVGHAAGLVFIAMELVTGRTLRAVLNASAAPLADAPRIALEMAAGLAALHAAGLIHRDIKPENVMISDSGAVKILDFGLAKLVDVAGSVSTPQAGDTTTLARRWVGTPSYMSPEQARGSAADTRSDVFSLGALLYELLAGKRPFRGATAVDVLAAVVRDEPAPLSGLPNENLMRLARVAERCLRKDPRERYRDGQELLQAIKAAASARVTSSPKRIAKAASAALALLLSGTAVWHYWSATPRTLLDSAEAQAQAAPAASVATTHSGSMLALPAPTSTSAAAVIAYRAALQSFHDSNWGQAELNLREALRLDPLLGSAYLRLALIMSYLDYTALEAKTIFREALRLRATLLPRDRDLLTALEPLLNADPVDLEATVQRLRELTQRYPRDAELFMLLGIYSRWGGPAGQLEAAKRALAIDPEYPDAWAAFAEASVDRDPLEARAALERCISIAPGAADCRMVRATLESALGHCVEAERQIRQATDDPQASECMFHLRARYLYALGEPRAAVADAFGQRWARLQASAAREDSLYDSALVAAAYGDFVTAQRKAEEGLRLIDTQATLRAHARFSTLLVEIQLETGQTQAAAAVASSFLARRSAWQRGLPTEDPSVFMARVLAREGQLSLGEVRQRRDSWYQAALASVGEQQLLGRNVWRLAYVQGIDQEDDARAALATRPAGAQAAILDEALDVALGRALWLAGADADALPYLARAHARCDRLSAIVPAMQSDLLYAQALTKNGQQTEACGVYRSILDRWGNAKPRSLTAQQARRRSRALGCKPAD